MRFSLDLKVSAPGSAGSVAEVEHWKSSMSVLIAKSLNERPPTVLGGLQSFPLWATRTLLSSVWAAAAVPASVLTAARKLKYFVDPGAFFRTDPIRK